MNEAGDVIDAIVVGAGPAGLIAAETLAASGLSVMVFDAMGAPARKLLMAGRGGLNLTHSEPMEAFLSRYHPASSLITGAVRAFPPDALVAWAEDLGVPTFIGSSGRVFPKSLKASPLLRAWLARLSTLGVQLHLRHKLVDLACDGAGPGAAHITATFRRQDGSHAIFAAKGVVLALGGASWPRLGSDGGWAGLLAGKNVDVADLVPANAALRVHWSEHIRSRFAGTPLKRIVLGVAGETFPGELVLTRDGLEGGPAYGACRLVREALERDGSGRVDAMLDLRPDLTVEALAMRLAKPRGKQSLASFLRKAAGLAPPMIALLHEPPPERGTADGPPWQAKTATPVELAQRIKALPLTITGIGGLERAISSAGGVTLASLDDNFMVKALPGVFAAGEMLDWEAPTGGYLLQACFATGAASARGLLGRLGIGQLSGPAPGAEPAGPGAGDHGAVNSF
ncbi:MAG: TIGR03862 family flavoprotein [Hyphomicrobiaceae bacterium]|nr:TIGR03862 family flavoprotein [Hyphomicrobiaceae bacterium]